MKKFLEKILDKYFEYKLKKDKEEIKITHEIDALDYEKWNLDDYDDWTEDEAEDLLTWGKTDLLHN